MGYMSHSTWAKYKKYLVWRRKSGSAFRCFKIKIRGNSSNYRQQMIVWTNVYCDLSERLHLFGKVTTLCEGHNLS